jgi:hypothetical protein
MTTGINLPDTMTDKLGRCKPVYMTDGEIKAELAGDTDRHAALSAEMQSRRDSRRNARAKAVSTAAAG